jgi:uncharacterized membrane protein
MAKLYRKLSSRYTNSMQEIFHHEPKEGFLDKATKAIAWFMGSWWGVFAHTAWFMGWIVTGANIDDLTLWVSLEAIFIGIFLLMASNKAEEERDRKERIENAKQMAEVKEDVSLDRQQLDDLDQIKKDLAQIKSQLKTTKTKSKKK